MNELPSVESFYSSLGFGDYTSLIRVGSFKVNPNEFGILLAMVIPLFIYRFFSKDALFREKLINFLFTVLALICLFATVSRGAILAFVFGVIFMLLFIAFRNKVWKIFLLVSVMLGLLFVFLTKNPISERFLEERQSYYGRIIVASTILDNIKENPMFGFGFRNLSSSVGAKIRYEYLINAHNFWLDFLAGNGIPGLVLVLFFQIIIFYLLVKLIRYFRNVDRESYLRGVAIFSMFIAITIYGISGTASDDWLPFLIFFFLYYSSYLYSSRLKPSKKSSI